MEVPGACRGLSSSPNKRIWKLGWRQMNDKLHNPFLFACVFGDPPTPPCHSWSHGCDSRRPLPPLRCRYLCLFGFLMNASLLSTLYTFSAYMEILNVLQSGRVCMRVRTKERERERERDCLERLIFKRDFHEVFCHFRVGWLEKPHDNVMTQPAFLRVCVCVCVSIRMYSLRCMHALLPAYT